jgi:RNA polymerase sigma factor for flagellar operon FliA
MSRTLEARVIEMRAVKPRAASPVPPQPAAATRARTPAIARGNGTEQTRAAEATPPRPAPALVRPQAVARGTEARERAIEDVLARYSPLVKYVVDKISATLPKTVDIDDLQSSAVIGLYDAWEKFDSSRGTKFETYAVWRIRGAVLDELRALDWASRTTRRKARRVEEVSRGLDQKLGRAASDNELADALGLDSREFFRVSDEVRSARHLSLERPQSNDESSDVMGLSEAIEAADAVDCLEAVELGEARGILLGAINHLPEQERLVVALYYYEELTLKEIGEILGISESRVSQVHTKAIRRLKRRVPELAA